MLFLLIFFVKFLTRPLILFWAIMFFSFEAVLFLSFFLEKVKAVGDFIWFSISEYRLDVSQASLKFAPSPNSTLRDSSVTDGTLS